MYYSLKDGLKYNGRTYKRGEKLDLRTGIRDQRLLNTMVRMRKVRIGQDELTVVVENTTGAEIAVIATDTPEPSESTGAEIVHNGGGYYKVMLAGIELSAGVTLKGKEAAEQWSKENGVS